MLLSQINKGTEIFAVTDHLDVYSYMDYDVFTPIRNSNAEVHRLSEIYDGKCKVLSGVEVSEVYWVPEVYKKHTFDVDLIIGSVHLVRCPEHPEPYSRIDFSQPTQDWIYSYLELYFKDVLMLLDTVDFDILAHLTCPLRYIVGKYRRSVDPARFDGEIEEILRRVIKDKKAFEINTSSFDMLNDFMPSRKIIEKYYSLGGRLISFGSDAHVPENASVNFDKAIAFAKDVGFENICYFENREVRLLRI
ncbi:MAG: hypothetical protein IKV53_00020 [Clostridia bacterium]|nr:hypothetical protein [Clostridia bacterium]